MSNDHALMTASHAGAAVAQSLTPDPGGRRL